MIGKVNVVWLATRRHLQHVPALAEVGPSIGGPGSRFGVFGVQVGVTRGARHPIPVQHVPAIAGVGPVARQFLDSTTSMTP